MITCTDRDFKLIDQMLYDLFHVAEAGRGAYVTFYIVGSEIVTNTVFNRIKAYLL